ncbi:MULTISPECIES: hypothetical protein [unclassified Rhizobium]|uniref:hypothetical protein n=1 Tax=unclassified Rhizobium TaxID=2613769 RepID=UPI001FD16EC7|nr:MULTISPECIES: hypothetical protein [unclassified Rhizobium]
MRESDISFRNLDDYKSTYRQNLDDFNAIKVALTAHPRCRPARSLAMPFTIMAIAKRR